MLTIGNYPTIYLVRHATPDWNRRDIPYHLPPGPPLTAQGEQEAVRLGEFMREMGVRLILASPLERCQRTAQIVAGFTGAPVREDVRLQEVQPEEKAPELLARVWPAWAQAREACLDSGPVALVSHGGPIGALLAELGAKPPRLFDHGNPLPPAGAWRALRPQPDAPWALDLAYSPETHRARAWCL